jgi:hypothetical protein
MNFFKNKLGGYIYADKNEQSRKELNEFVTNLSHFSEEEQIVFLLALKADLL